mmetsp:Transcript_59414/g.137268  ORF Transcript_59414/g.137268 Transcript_59414/m.137268 type:complete len:283 (-) Transcript_59414:110-958(-)
MRTVTRTREKNAAEVPAADLDFCKQICVRLGFGGFSVRGGRAYFRSAKGGELKTRLTHDSTSTFYLRDEKAEEVQFDFRGTEAQQQATKQRIWRWVRGDLVGALNATEAEVDALRLRMIAMSDGSLCRVSERVAVGFGRDLKRHVCAKCHVSCSNWGCRGCNKTFCATCMQEHLGHSARLRWMWADGAYWNSWSWSADLCVSDLLAELGADGLDESSEVRVKVVRAMTHKLGDVELPDAPTAVKWLEEFGLREQSRYEWTDCQSVENFVEADVSLPSFGAET